MDRPSPTTSATRRTPRPDEQPGLEVYHPPTPAREQGNTAPEVYWDENVNPSQYTFYREGTPPPPEEEKRPKETFADHSAAAVETAQREEPKTKLVSTKRLGIIIIVLVAIILIAVGIGVGVGVSRAKQASSDASGSASSTSTMDPMATPTSSPPSDPTAVSAFTCPSANNTVYNVPGSTKTFQHLCGIDFGGNGEANDLGQVLTTTMERCMDQCAIFPGCMGCAWGLIPGDKGPSYRCWMKSNLTNSHRAVDGWSFAILI